MITLVIALATIFSPTAYVTGLGNMVSPTLMVLGNIGFSSANKSGLYNLLMTTTRKVTGALNALKSSFRDQEEGGVYAPSQNIPVEDKTANIPAANSSLLQCLRSGLSHKTRQTSSVSEAEKGPMLVF